MLLRIGSRGDNVRLLQNKLGIEADGIFGRGTQAAVKRWQARNGLIADGIVGPKTWAKLTKSNSSIVENKKPIENIVINNNELNINKLIGHIPNEVISQISSVINKFNINTRNRLAHFLSQCAHESQNFQRVYENLNYSAKGLRRVFPKYFPNNLSITYAMKPEKIASRVYGNRMGNGNEASREGYKFRGRGYIQLTGKDNYRAFSKAINVDLISNPELVATKYPLLSAAWFFNQNCIKKADIGPTRNAILSVSKCVNGGYNGLEERIEYFKKFYKLLG
jgi:putative chitinase